MIKRIVKLDIKDEHREEFVTIFKEFQSRIVASKGCKEVELLNDINHPNIFFTVSLWESEEDLNAYRFSETFGEVWPRTKRLFKSDAKAWSTRVVG